MCVAIQNYVVQEMLYSGGQVLLMKSSIGCLDVIETRGLLLGETLDSQRIVMALRNSRKVT